MTVLQQTDLFHPDNWTDPVHLIGVGGVGSATLLFLAKLLGRQKIEIWDGDTVEEHNVPGQLPYGMSDVGRKKVVASQEAVARFGLPIEIVAHDAQVTSETKLKGVVISAVHTMAARHDIWKAVRFNSRVPLYLDARIGGEMAQLLTVDPLDPSRVKQYESFLTTDDEVDQDLSCSQSTYISTPAQIAAWVCSNLTSFARGELPVFNRVTNLGKM